MQLITNRIQTGKPGCFEDFIEKYQKEHQEKVASVDEEVKVAAEQEEADSSGQLDVEPLHQEGESTTMPKAGPSAKKDEGEKSAVADTNPEKDGKDSGQPKAEGSEKFTNDPETPTKGKKEGGEDEETKTAKEKDNVKEAALEDLPQEVQDKIKGKSSDDAEEEKEQEEDEEDKEVKEENKEEKEAVSKTQFVKWANLDSKNKEFLVKYWKQLFGDDYVNALVSDK